MLHNYIKINTDKIVKATPSGYIITELKNNVNQELYWTNYTTSQFSKIGINDFTIDNTENPRIIENLFDVFIQNKSAAAIKEGITTSTVSNAINIESIWDKRFPETIRLKYPGVITSGNSISEKQKLSNEENYTFKVWENRSSSSIGVANTMPDVSVPTINSNNYFYDLLSFIKLDSESSYENWLKRPLLSLRNLLSKGIEKDGKLYQLYKINDVNVQSLSKNFDEYIPWCFDQNGTKIDQYKIATITSFNKKEIYILLEIRATDVYIGSESIAEIPSIKSIVFWRSGILDNRITMDIRNKDKVLLTKDNNVSNISDYFRETNINTNTLVNFQKNRLENELTDIIPVDNDDTSSNSYQLEAKTDTYFMNAEAKDILKRFIFGYVPGSINDIELAIVMGEKSFTDHFKSKVHIFANGNILTNDQFYILDGIIHTTLSSIATKYYVEVYIDQYDSVSYSFNIEDATTPTLTQDELSYILYNNGFLWKTTQDKEYLLFNKSEDSCKFVDGALITGGNYLIIHSIFFNLNDITSPIPNSSVTTTEEVTDVSDARDYNINYDPVLFKTSANGGSNILSNKDIWIFDNTKNLIKVNTNEPYMEKINNKIEIMGETDRNIALEANQIIIDLKTALTINPNTGQGNIHNEIISSAEKAYLVEHYGQMSTLNRNILTMFLYSGASNWTNLAANTPVRITKDYLIVRYTDTGDFPILKIIKPNIYKYNTELGSVDVKVKPAKVTDNYYILHRTDDVFSNLYDYSFNKAISYIMI